MRIGQNPEKQNIKLETEIIHRIMIPVYIPNLTDEYFKDALDILKLCVNSLLKTIHSKTRISIIDNGCCDTVSDYLKSLYNERILVDQLFSSKYNLGKINALYSVIKSNLEPIITIADADVMFLPGWQKATEHILDSFPEAGMVSPVPSSVAYAGYHLNSTIYYSLFKGNISFSKVLNPEGLLNFQRSIGRELYNAHHLDSYLTISNRKSTAVLGCGHFVATFRTEVFEHASQSVCMDKIGGVSVREYIDHPNDIGGFLRLATLDNYAYHLGNVKEDWMEKMLDDEFNIQTQEGLDCLSKAQPLKYYQYFIGKVLHKLLFTKFKKQFFRYKGLSKKASEQY